MSYLTVGGFGCVRGRVTLPRIGVWVADVLLEPTSAPGAPPAPGSHVVLMVGGLPFAGTVRRAQNAWGSVFARIVGGGGGLPTMLPARAYQSIPLRMALGDLLSACQEALSPTSDPTLLSTQLASWSRTAGPGFVGLAALRDAFGCAWRVLPDGSHWFGAEGWPQSTIGKASVLAYEPNELKMRIYADRPSILPGQTYGGMHVSAVTHVVEPEQIRSELLFEDPQLEAAA